MALGIPRSLDSVSAALPVMNSVMCGLLGDGVQVGPAAAWQVSSWCLEGDNAFDEPKGEPLHAVGVEVAGRPNVVERAAQEMFAA